MENYNVKQMQLFELYKNSCNIDFIECIINDTKTNSSDENGFKFIYKNFINDRDKELNNYPKLKDYKENLKTYNNVYGQLFKQVIMLFYYSHDYSINKTYEDNGAYLNRFNLTLIKIKKNLENIRDKSFTINDFLLQNKYSLAIDYQIYCINVHDSLLHILNRCEIQIQNTPLNELFQTSKQGLINSINIELIKLSKEANEPETSISKKKKTEDFIWFKVGLLFAQGIPQKLYSKYKNDNFHFKKITLELGFKESDRPYFSETINNCKTSTSNDDKNIYKKYDKMKSIYDYCILNNIDICSQFIAQYNQIKPD